MLLKEIALLRKLRGIAVNIAGFKSAYDKAWFWPQFEKIECLEEGIQGQFITFIKSSTRNTRKTTLPQRLPTTTLSMEV